MASGRDQLDKLVGGLTRGEVTHFEDELRDLDDGYATAEEIAALILEARQPEVPAGQLVRRRAREPDEPQLRMRAVSALVAKEATGRSEVHAFRRRYLRGGFVKWSEADAWIRRRAARSGRLRVAWVSQGGGTFRLPVKPDSPLDRLRALSVELARDYEWLEGQATVFVLCDLIPLVPSVRATARQRWPLTGLSRVTLDADPAAAPAEVEAAFRHARRQLVREGQRFRDPAPKNLRLAIFSAERDLPAAQLFAAWNRAHPAEGYSSLESFTRAIDRVSQQLLEPYQ